MKSEIKKRIEQIKNGEIPEGYSRSKIGIFPEDWSVVSFDDKFSRLDRKNDEDNQNVLTISAQQGLISQQDYYNTSYASENKKGYSLLYKGDFSYNKSYSCDYMYGAIKRLDKYEKGIVSPLYICFEPKEGTNSEFYLQYFEAGLFNGEIYKIAQEGARNHGLLNVPVNDFFKTYLINPSCEEQQKIAEILMQCDKIIDLYQREIDELKKLKKACLRKMFPQKGKNVPELRFHQFTEPWEQRKLGEMGTTYTGLTGKNKEDFGHGDARFVTYMNVFSNPITNLEMTEQVEIDNKQNEVEAGDVFFTTSSETPEEVGMTSVMLENMANTYLNSFCFGYRPTEKFDCHYLACMLRSDSVRKSIVFLAQGISRYNISKNKIMAIEVPLPELAEQEKIGAYFSNIDHFIALHQRKLEEQKKQKKSLMQLLLTGIVRVKI